MSSTFKGKTISRRSFITAATGTAVALAAAPSVIAQSKTTEYQKSDKLMRIGVVGGRFGASFQWHEHPNCRVTAVCDLRDDRIET
ncbi:MAG: twin-arginine translocation signal domain-containing protein, partial [Gemmatimonadota bacterium]|nr:twin-arginine translocation signal domain-containing protein [Gemmatimonadota bacterium]